MIEYDLDTQSSILHVQPKSAIEQDDSVKLAKAVAPHIEATGGFGTPQQWVARSRPSGSSPHRLVTTCVNAFLSCGLNPGSRPPQRAPGKAWRSVRFWNRLAACCEAR